jgi:hypothetical protein
MWMPGSLSVTQDHTPGEEDSATHQPDHADRQRLALVAKVAHTEEEQASDQIKRAHHEA